MLPVFLDYGGDLDSCHVKQGEYRLTGIQSKVNAHGPIEPYRFDFEHLLVEFETTVKISHKDDHGSESYRHFFCASQ